MATDVRYSLFCGARSPSELTSTHTGGLVTALWWPSITNDSIRLSFYAHIKPIWNHNGYVHSVSV